MVGTKDNLPLPADSSRAQLSISPVEAKSLALLNHHVNFMVETLQLIHVLGSEICDDRLLLLLRGSRIDLCILRETINASFPNMAIRLDLE